MAAFFDKVGYEMYTTGTRQLVLRSAKLRALARLIEKN